MNSINGGNRMARNGKILIKIPIGIKLSYAIMLLTVVIIFSSVYNLIQIQNEINKNYTEKLIGESNAIEKSATGWVNENLIAIALVKDIYDNLSYKDLTYQKNENKYLKLNFQNSVSDALYIGLDEGTFLSATDWKPPNTYDPRKRPWYIDALKTNAAVLGDLYIDADTHKYIFTISTPFMTSDGIKGAIGIDIYLDTLASQLKSSVSGTKFDIAIFDGNGLIVNYTGDPYVSGHKVEDYPNSKLFNIYKGYLKQPLLTDRNIVTDENSMMTFSKIPNSHWTLAVFTKERIATSDTSVGVQQHYIINGLIVALSLGVIYRFYTMDVQLKRNQAEMLIKIEELNQAHEVIENSNKQHEYKSYTDGLTHVFNRRYFDDILEKYWNQGLSDSKNIGIAMIDVDHFKKYNEHFGHVTGDQMLIKLCRDMSNLLSSKFILARYGGEKFAVLAYDVTEEELCSVSHILKEAIYNNHYTHDYSNHQYISLSVGVNVFLPQEEESIGNFIHKADLALYEAKQTGRNKVLLYTEPK